MDLTKRWWISSRDRRELRLSRLYVTRLAATFLEGRRLPLKARGDQKQIRG